MRNDWISSFLPLDWIDVMQLASCRLGGQARAWLCSSSCLGVQFSDFITNDVLPPPQFEIHYICIHYL